MLWLVQVTQVERQHLILPVDEIEGPRDADQETQVSLKGYA